MTELWKPVPGFPGYSVSENGQVHSARTDKLLKPNRTPKGYLYVSLMFEGKAHSKYIHELVLITFKGVRPEGNEGRHLNGDKEVNTVSNLAWGTPEQNRQDNVLNGVKTRKPSFDYEAMKKARGAGLSFSQIAEKFGCSIGTAHRSCHV